MTKTHSSDIVFSIVGYGRIGARHAEHIRKQSRLTAVCDTDQEALKRAAKECPEAALYTNVEELLQKDTESTVVNVCTPNGLHAAHTIAALEAGKHVVCEKPMCLTVKNASAMIQAAERSKKHLFIVKQNRFNPPVQKVKKLLDSGGLGRIYSAQLNCFWNRNDRYYRESPWKGTRELDGGILFTQFSHFIDLLYWFLGDVKAIRAFSENYRHTGLVDFEDTLTALLMFESGCMATLNSTINSYGKNMEGSITLFGEKGTIKIGGQYLNVLEYQNIEGKKIRNVDSFRPANEYGFYQGSMSNHDQVIANVIDVLTRNGRIATTAEEGKKTVEIIERIYREVRRG
jgi:predicted dehydrogenase